MATPQYSLDKKDLLSFGMMSDVELALPRYQRAGSQWNADKKLGFAMSIMLGFPTGSVTMRYADGKQWLIDGRQRLETIRDLLNPYELAIIVKSAVPEKWLDESTTPATPYPDWTRRICSFAKGWLQRTDNQDFEETYSKWAKAALEQELKKRGLTHTGTNKEMTERLATDDAQSGSQLDKKYVDNLKPLTDLIETLDAIGKTDNTSPSAGFTNTFKTNGKGFVEAWNPTKKNHPPFWEEAKNANGWAFKPEIFGQQLTEFYHIQSWDPKKCNDAPTFVSWAKMKWPKVETDKLVKIVQKKKWELGNRELFKTLDALKEEFRTNTLGVTRLNCDAHEAMKVFHLINATGVQLTEVQKLAAWPAWNELLFDAKTPATSALADAVEALYEEQEIPYDKDTVSRWDIAATLTKRLRHNEIWGGEK